MRYKGIRVTSSKCLSKDFEDSILILHMYYDEVQGPYFDNTHKRNFITLWKKKPRKIYKLDLGKATLEIKLGRKLVADEDCDHIDENKLNNHPDNLQILSKALNTSKSRKFQEANRAK